MAATLARLEEFNPEGGNFDVYLERFELFAAVNGIADDRKRQLFLATIGNDAYLTLRRLLSPKTPIEASFEEAASVLRNHYSPRRSVVSQRCRFGQRKQKPNETITDFIVAIKKIAAECEFGGFLQEALRDRLVTGLRSDAIRRRLLAMPDEELSWERTCSVATELEAADRVAKDVPPSGDGIAWQASTSAAYSVPWHQLSAGQGRRPGTGVEAETLRSTIPEARHTSHHSGVHQRPANFPAIKDERAEGITAKELDKCTSSSSSHYIIAHPMGQTMAAVEEMARQYRGIQGHHGSCYPDAILFAMFACTFTFDDLLVRPREADDIEEYEEVQRVLREDIVQTLRAQQYVPYENVRRLRHLLDSLDSLRASRLPEERDSEEFLNSLFFALRVQPLVKLSSGGDTHLYQLFVGKIDDLKFPTVQQLFHQSIHDRNVKLKKIPKALIIQARRLGEHFKLYDCIMPSLELDITDALEDSPRFCFVCGRQASLECRDCFRPLIGLEGTSYCEDCSETAHLHHERQAHKPKKLLDVTEGAGAVYGRIRMTLFAVVCCEASRYVCFVKCPVGNDKYTWCFFDSMAASEGGYEGQNIPCVRRYIEARSWLGKRGCETLREIVVHRGSRLLPNMTRRLMSDAYMYMYESNFAKKYA